MKYLSVIRHAKAARPDKYDTDVERPLTKRGVNDSDLVAKKLSLLSPKVDWLVSSPSVRTRETVDRFVRALHYDEPVIWEQELYGADAGTLLDILSSVPVEIEHAVIIGHNPGMEALVSGLCTGSTVRLNLSMPTATLAHLELDIRWWNQIRWGCGQLQILLKPKLLRAR